MLFWFYAGLSAGVAAAGIASSGVAGISAGTSGIAGSTAGVAWISSRTALIARVAAGTSGVTGAVFVFFGQSDADCKADGGSYASGGSCCRVVGSCGRYSGYII